MSKLKKVLIITSISLVLLVLFVGVSVWLAVGYGGLGGFISELKKPPSNSTLEKLSSEAKIEITQAQEKLGSLPELTLYEKTFSNMCAKGDHDWMGSDSYSHICVYRLTYYYGIDAGTSYKNVLLELEKNLSDMDWTVESQSPKQPTISEVLNQYPEDLSLLHLPEYGNTKFYKVGALDLNINTFKGIYDGYNWTTQKDEPQPFGFGVADYQIFYKQQSDQSLKEISEKIISQGRLPFMFSISEEYFEN